MLHNSAPAPQPFPIAECFAKCSDAFKRFYIALAADECQHVERVALSRISDEYGRLGVWGANSLANRQGRGSLDDTLRDDPDLHSIILELLTDLSHDLEAGTILARTPKQADESIVLDDEGNKISSSTCESDSDSDSISITSSSSETSSPKGPEAARVNGEMRRLVSSVFDAIRSLYRISVLLKRPTMPAKYLRSTTSENADAKSLSCFEYWDQQHVVEKMNQWAADVNQPYDTPIDGSYFLTARLATANTGRRKQLRYWQKHPDYMIKEEQRVESSLKPDELQVGHKMKGHSLVKSLPEKPRSEAITSPSGPTIQSFSTVALTVLNDNETFSGRPRTIYAPSAAGGKHSRVPDAPKAHPGSRNVQCPYCFALLDSLSMRKRDLWKKHVFRDLRPYVCTFEHCLNPDKMFVTRHDWWYHEMQMHRRRWVCTGNCNRSFKSKASIERHMREAHAKTFTELQLPVLIDMCERPENPTQATECPLCPQENILSGLEAHVGSHLEELALFIIPVHQDDSSENGGSDRAVGAAENLDRSDLDELSSLDSFSEAGLDSPATSEINSGFTAFFESDKNPAEPLVQTWIENEHNSNSPLTQEHLRHVSLGVQKQKGRRCAPGQSPRSSIRDESKPYQCTLGCGAYFENLDDWRKHEEVNYPQVGWICSLEPVVSVAGSPSVTCSYCGLRDPGLDHIDKEHSHMTPCHQKSIRDSGKVFYSEEEFRSHFEQVHKGVSCQDQLESSRFQVKKNYPKSCGFCNHQFTDWRDRIGHIGTHFIDGKDMSQWHGNRSENQDRTTTEDQTVGGEKLSAAPLSYSNLPTESTQDFAITSAAASTFQSNFGDLSKDIVRFPCFSLRSNERNIEFLGRQDTLRLIDEHIFPNITSMDRGRLHSLVLSGIGGIGKTQVAIEYAYSRRELFDAIFWLYANDKSILVEQFAGIATELGLEEPGSEAHNLAASCELVQAWLSNPVKSSGSGSDKASWLIIFDDVDDFEILKDYWPSSSHGAVLVTSRDPNVQAIASVENRVADLPPFTFQESLKFMKILTRGLSIDKDSLNLISETVGGLPLAIKQTAQIMNDLQIPSYKDFILVYKQMDAKQLMKKQKESTGRRGERSLPTIWALDRLSDETLTLLEVLSLLNPDGIPENILVEGCAHVAVARYPKSRFDYNKAIGELIESSLVRVNRERQEICLHRVVQDTIRAEMNDLHFRAIFQAALTLVGTVWPFQTLIKRHYVARVAKCAEIFPCVLRLKEFFIEEITCKRSFQPDHSFAELLNDSGWYLLERGLVQESKSYFELVQWICENSENMNSETVAQTLRLSHNNQTTAASETNDRKSSLDHALIWLQMMLERKEPSGLPLLDYELAIVYNETGVAYGLNELWETAAEYFIKSTCVLKELNTYEDTMLGWPQPNLGLIYWIQGRYEDSEHVLTEILDIQTRAFGINDTESFKTGKILHALGNLYSSQGRMNESFDLHIRAFKQYSVTLGQAHHRTADVCYRLAVHYMRLNQLNEAYNLLDKAWKVFSKNPCYNPERARATFKKSQLLEQMGKVDESFNARAIAIDLRTSLVKDGQRGSDIREEDFDNLVAFWSR